MLMSPRSRALHCNCREITSVAACTVKHTKNSSATVNCTVAAHLLGLLFKIQRLLLFICRPTVSISGPTVLPPSHIRHPHTQSMARPIFTPNSKLDNNHPLTQPLAQPQHVNPP